MFSSIYLLFNRIFILDILLKAIFPTYLTFSTLFSEVTYVIVRNPAVLIKSSSFHGRCQDPKSCMVSVLSLCGHLRGVSTRAPTERREMSGVGSSCLFDAWFQLPRRKCAHIFPTELYKASFLRLVFEVATLSVTSRRIYDTIRVPEAISGIAFIVIEHTITRVNGNLEWLLIGARTQSVQFAKEHAHEQTVSRHEHETWKVDWEREANEITADIPIPSWIFQ